MLSVWPWTLQLAQLLHARPPRSPALSKLLRSSAYQLAEVLAEAA